MLQRPGDIHNLIVNDLNAVFLGEFNDFFARHTFLVLLRFECFHDSSCSDLENIRSFPMVIPMREPLCSAAMNRMICDGKRSKTYHSPSRGFNPQRQAYWAI